MKSLSATSTKKAYEEVHTYHYVALVSTGVYQPPYVSEFNIQGNLKIQRKISEDKTDLNIYYIALLDLKHSSYYGSIPRKDFQVQPVPSDIRELEIPFLAIYDKNGKVLYFL